MAKRFFKPVLREAVVIALLGAVLAFAANALSPKGLDLHRAYLAPKQDNQPPDTSIGSSTNKGAPALTEEQHTIAHLQQEGLQTMDTPKVEALSRDVRFQQQQVILIDVRDDNHYDEGHIPGAFHFDFYYHKEQIAQVVPVCQSAQQVIVYCNGGKCDTSEAAALFLRDEVKIPAEKLYVYVGGMADWEARGLPVETGSQNSGKLKDPAHAR
jgi:rhodanese-related sulfurtransferase